LQPRAARLRLAAHLRDVGEPRAQIAQQLGLRARQLGEVVELARDVRGVLAGERDLERVGRARRVARGKDAAERCLLAGQARLERALARGEARELRLQCMPLRLERAQPPVGVGDGALGVAQRVARLAPLRLLLAQPGLERLDARAQRLQVLLAARSGGRAGAEQQREDERAPQAFAFPCAAVAATRRATSSASPR
jgi:hypothetical protein